tara:strand:- start:29 stop:322 length:294 start_codon:yes stop_codon:yes gene_type:complete
MTATKKRLGRPRKTTTTKVTKRVTKTGTYNNMHEIASDVNVVIKSLITQDGRFTPQEASAISKLYGNQLSLAKLELDHARISTAKTTTTKDILSLGN